MPIPRNRRRNFTPKAAPSVSKPSASGFYEKDGSPIESTANCKVGDTLYKHRAGKLVQVSVKSVKPFEIQEHLAGHGSKAAQR